MKYPVFSFHLRTKLVENAMSPRRLANALGHREPFIVTKYLEGTELPSLREVYVLAVALDSDPLEMLGTWVADQSPEFELLIWAEILIPRGSDAKPSANLDVHRPRLPVLPD